MHDQNWITIQFINQIWWLGSKDRGISRWSSIIVRDCKLEWFSVPYAWSYMAMVRSEDNIEPSPVAVSSLSLKSIFEVYQHCDNRSHSWRFPTFQISGRYRYSMGDQNWITIQFIAIMQKCQWLDSKDWGISSWSSITEIVNKNDLPRCITWRWSEDNHSAEL